MFFGGDKTKKGIKTGLTCDWHKVDLWLEFHFMWERKLWLNGEFVLQADFWWRLLIWMVFKDHFTRLWGLNCHRLTRFAMFENSVNTEFHACFDTAVCSFSMHKLKVQLHQVLMVSFLSVFEITPCACTKTITYLPFQFQCGRIFISISKIII